MKYSKHPKFSAKTIAASFPDGNISPYNKSSIEIHSFSVKFAVVPMVSEAPRETEKYNDWVFKLNRLASLYETKQVIVFVNDAISRYSYGFKPVRY